MSLGNFEGWVDRFANVLDVAEKEEVRRSYLYVQNGEERIE